MSSPSTFLTVPGEIRNHIYLQVALDAPILRLFEGRVVLPPLASVCRQIRKEMNGKYQRDATLNPETPIHALVTNFNFHCLSRWLDKHNRDLKDRLNAPRVLCITSVLLAPDAAADLSSPKDLPKDKAATFSTASQTPTHSVTNKGAQTTLLVKPKLSPGALPQAGPASSSQGTTPSGSCSQRTRSVKLKPLPRARPRFGLQLTTSSRQRVSSSPRNAGEEALRRTTSDEFQNSLRVLEQSLDEWCRTWTSCENLCRSERDRHNETREISSAYFLGQADRSGTRYVIGWKARTIHREHPIPRAVDTHDLQRRGVCYRGDFCDHFVHRNMDQIIDRARNGRQDSRIRFLEWLKYSMCFAHFVRTIPRHSFQQVRTDDGEWDRCFHPWERCKPCGEILRFYQRLNQYNMDNRVFEQDMEVCRMYNSVSRVFKYGRKRTSPDNLSNEAISLPKRRVIFSPYCDCREALDCPHTRLKARQQRYFVWYEDDRLLNIKVDQMVLQMDRLSLDHGESHGMLDVSIE